MKKILIKIGKSETLWRATQAALFGAGLRWERSGTILQTRLGARFGDDGVIFIHSLSDKTFQAWLERAYVNPNRVFDAATEMGKLIAFLEAPQETVVKNVAQNSSAGWHDAAISSDGKSVTVGCSRVTYEKVKEVYEKMSALVTQ